MGFIPDEAEVVKRERREAPPSHYVLKVENFSKLWRNGIDKYESKEFEAVSRIWYGDSIEGTGAGILKWKIVLYPNGNKSRSGENYISMYLAVGSTCTLPAGWVVNAFYKFFLLDQLRGNYMVVEGGPKRFNGVNREWGITRFVQLDTFFDPSSGYLVNDACFFGVEVFVNDYSGVGECISLLDRISTYQHQWRIPNFSELIGDLWNSDEFLVGGYKWMLTLYPKGNGDGSPTVCLVAVGARDFSPAQNVKAEYTITINDISHTASSWFSASRASWGFSCFMSEDDFDDPAKGYIVQDCCIIQVEVKVLAEILQDTREW